MLDATASFQCCVEMRLLASISCKSSWNLISSSLLRLFIKIFDVISVIVRKIRGRIVQNMIQVSKLACLLLLACGMK